MCLAAQASPQEPTPLIAHLAEDQVHTALIAFLREEFSPDQGIFLFFNFSEVSLPWTSTSTLQNRKLLYYYAKLAGCLDRRNG